MRHRMGAFLRRHPLFRSLLDMRGNVRACVYLEPLWGIPYNLYVPYATLYMYGFGIGDEQIGLLLSIGMVFQVVASLLGGIATDKLGRRKATVIFDVISWSIPCIIWALAQNFWWFFVATVLNSMWQITNNSWNCLLVEDCPPKMLVNVYTWTTVSGLLAVFFAPLSGLLVERFSVQPVMRALYVLSFIMMTAKFLILFFCCKETTQGKVRQEQTRNESVWTMLAQYKGVFLSMLRNPATMTIMAIMVLINITTMLTSNFFGLYITQDLGVAEPLVALFPIARAIVMLAFLFTVQAAINRLPFKKPMLWGLALYVVSMALLLLAPASHGHTLLCLGGYMLCEAFGYALLMPRKDSILVLFVDPQERARILGLLYVVMIGLSTPFGWIGGWLSGINRMLPFLLNIVLYVLVGVVIARSKPIATDMTAASGEES